MTSASAALAVCTMVPVLLWGSLGVLLWRVRRRGRLPAGAVQVFLLGGVSANAYPVAVAAGVRLPGWMLVPGVVVAVAVGYGYALVQLCRYRSVAGPRRQQQWLTAGSYRASVARLNETQTDRAGVDASGADETEAR